MLLPLSFIGLRIRRAPHVPGKPHAKALFSSYLLFLLREELAVQHAEDSFCSF